MATKQGRRLVIGMQMGPPSACKADPLEGEAGRPVGAPGRKPWGDGRAGLATSPPVRPASLSARKWWAPIGCRCGSALHADYQQDEWERHLLGLAKDCCV